MANCPAVWQKILTRDDRCDDCGDLCGDHLGGGPAFDGQPESRFAGIFTA